MIPVTTASDTASSGAYSTTGAIVGAPGNYTTFVDATGSKNQRRGMEGSTTWPITEATEQKTDTRRVMGRITGRDRAGGA